MTVIQEIRSREVLGYLILIITMPMISSFLDVVLNVIRVPFLAFMISLLHSKVLHKGAGISEVSVLGWREGICQEGESAPFFSLSRCVKAEWRKCALVCMLNRNQAPFSEDSGLASFPWLLSSISTELLYV